MQPVYVNARFLSQPLTGVQRYGMEVCAELKKIYPQLILLAPQKILYPEWVKEMEVYCVGNTSGHVWEQITLPTYLHRRGKPILFSPCNLAPISYPKNIITVHDLAFLYSPAKNKYVFNKLYQWVIPKLVRRARHVFTVSHTMKDSLEQTYHLDPDKVSVTYNGIAQTLKKLRKHQPKEKIILSVGQFSSRKNHGKLLEAFGNSDLKDTYKLVLIGATEGLMMQAKQYDVSDRVECYTHISQNALADWYNRAEILVSLSAYEGFGLTVLEGLFFGCKVLCTHIDTYRELYQDKVYFCGLGETKAIADALLYLATRSSPKIDDHWELFEGYKAAAAQVYRQIVYNNPQ